MQLLLLGNGNRLGPNANFSKTIKNIKILDINVFIATISKIIFDYLQISPRRRRLRDKCKKLKICIFCYILMISKFSSSYLKNHFN